jgi:hypothetical protein
VDSAQRRRPADRASAAGVYDPGKLARPGSVDPVIRCNRPSPIHPDCLLGDGQGDPAPLVVVAPPGWLDDPDDVDRLICRGCATPDERDGWDDSIIESERITAEVVQAEGGPSAGAADPFDGDDLDSHLHE